MNVEHFHRENFILIWKIQALLKYYTFSWIITITLQLNTQKMWTSSTGMQTIQQRTRRSLFKETCWEMIEVQTNCSSVSERWCICLILTGVISPNISRSELLRQPYNETHLTPLPFTHRDKHIPFNPKVCASSRRCRLAPFSFLPSPHPPFLLFFQNSV